MFPWKLLETTGAYIFTWLIGYSALLGPIAGIMVVDYWIVRRQTLDVPDLYRTNGRYPAFNPVAMVALVAGVLPNIPGFLKAAGVLGETIAQIERTLQLITTAKATKRRAHTVVSLMSDKADLLAKSGRRRDAAKVLCESLQYIDDPALAEATLELARELER